jgi:hypothetical protein
VLTALVVALFPRLNAVLHEGQSFSQLDTEAAIGLPAIVAATFALFGLLGRWAWQGHGTNNRPARVALLSGTLALVGVVAFFVSAPIILGGFAVTLGVEGMRRAEFEGKRGRAMAATALGAVASLVGTIMWLVA